MRPPALEESDPRHPRLDPRYRLLDPNLLPPGECLKDTIERVLPCWHEQIVPALRRGQRPLIVAHGNSLRGLVKYLDHLSDDEVVNLEIPTGKPMVYELDDELNALKRYYL